MIFTMVVRSGRRRWQRRLRRGGFRRKGGESPTLIRPATSGESPTRAGPTPRRAATQVPFDGIEGELRRHGNAGWEEVRRTTGRDADTSGGADNTCGIGRKRRPMTTHTLRDRESRRSNKLFFCAGHTTSVLRCR